VAVVEQAIDAFHRGTKPRLARLTRACKIGASVPEN
jgi:hypothetical protein